MCGIFGVVTLGDAPLKHPQCLAQMAGSLAHRGPDGERIVGNARARLGARRLAIMDLTTGDQPFQSPDGAIWMVCNGEIYNSPALRREAQGWGYPFRSTGDIENIVPLYERYGPDAVSRLDGMFGLAVWDNARGRLVLARDRAGEKPLFWTRANDELRFASEIQALLVFPDQPRRVNGAAAALYAAMGYVPAPYTMLEGIHKLPPGQLLVADRQGVEVRPYWTPREAASAPSRLRDAAQLRGALLDAVRRELMSDVPVGVFTSGGLDSSFLAAAASRVMAGERIH
ncbi:MAG: asparagine synthetase B family protein, partial [Gemmatimonadales bacterium]